MRNIFVSSTFQDFEEERDVLRNNIQPKLNEKASEYGEYVSFCDLRWGIDTTAASEAENSEKILSSCLNQIDRAKPYFIVLIGERYGYMPGPECIAHEVDRHKDFWLDDLDISVTQLEIEYGALSRQDELDHVFFYFRENSNTKTLILEDETHIRKLGELKSRIERLAGNRIKYYSVDETTEFPLAQFANLVVDDLSEGFEAEWKAYAKLSFSERNNLVQWNYIQEKRKTIEGTSKFGDKIFNRIMWHAHRNAGILIQGPTGSGKSTVFSYICAKASEKGWGVVPYFCGSTPMTTDAKMLLNDIRSNTIQGKHILIAIDGLDQITSHKEYLPELICQQLPQKNVHFLYTASDEFAVNSNLTAFRIPVPKKKGKEKMLRKILKENGKELSDTIVREILNKNSSDNPLYLYLLISRLCIMNTTDYAAIRDSGNDIDAIYARQREIVEKLPGSLDDLSYELIHEAATRINNNMLQKACEYLAASRYGLRLKDIEHLLEKDDIYFSPLQFAQFVNYMNEMFLLRNDGRYDFLHKSLREGILKKCENRKLIHKILAEYMLTLSDEEIFIDNADETISDEYAKDFLLRAHEVVYHIVNSDDSMLFIKYAAGFLEPVAVQLLEEECCKIVLQTNGQWLLNISDMALRLDKESISQDVDEILREQKKYYHFDTVYRNSNAVIALIMGLATNHKSFWDSTELATQIMQKGSALLKDQCFALRSIINNSMNQLDFRVSASDQLRRILRNYEHMLDLLGKHMEHHAQYSKATYYYEHEEDICIECRQIIELTSSLVQISNKDDLLQNIDRRLLVIQDKIRRCKLNDKFVQ